MLISDSFSWAQTVFGQAELGDKRRTKRLVAFADSIAKNTGKSLVKSCQSSAEIEGAYRLLRNSEIDVERIADAGFEACAEQAKSHDLLLALEDTTSLKFGHKSVRDELGHITSNKKGRGMHAHSSLLFAPHSQQVVGLIEQHRWTRNIKTYGKRKHCTQTSYHEKESYKWERASRRVEERLGEHISNVITVCDREADIYDYLIYKVNHGHRFVVRSSQSRCIIEGDDKLYAFSSDLEPAGSREITVPQKGGRSARKATLAIRYAPITLKVPANKSGENIPLYYVGCSEDGESDLSWHLLTSEPVTNADEALKVVSYYERRWLIEDYHKAWKSGGTEVESQRMQSLENLERMIVILAFVATRVLQLKFMGVQGKEAPEQSCEAALTPIEWKLLWVKQEKEPLPDKAPSLYWAYINLAKLAGWQDSKRTGRVGWPTLWEGWFKLQTILEGYQLMKSLDHDL